MTTQESRDPGSLSRLLEELAEVPRPDLPAAYAAGLRPGASVGRFIIEREIGRGGFGVVYAALDPELGRTVALKLLKPGSTPARKGGDWLRREAEAVARLAHANIVTLHDFGRAPDGAYLVFELLRGETLAERLTRGPPPLPEIVHVALSVGRALAHAHAANVLHRDLKPANIFLCADGTVKVLDFGIAHLFEKDGPSTGGTPAYMAPEQWRAETGDARSDLFALGVLLHEMLTGTLPFGKKGAGKEGAGLEGSPPRAKAPARLRRLVAALTRRDPRERPASTHQVVKELTAIEATLRDGRRPWRLGAAALLVAALAVGGATLALRGEAPEGERVLVAIADADNATGDHDLDRLADLVAVALGESRRVQVVTRERLLAAGRGTAAAAAARVDARAGRLLAGLAGAHVLLVPSARRDGDGYGLDLRGEAPDGGPPLFTASARAPAKDAIPAALDGLVATARRELKERREDLRRSPVRLAAMTTSSLPAFREYVEGVDCASRPLEGAAQTGLDRCGAHFQRALGHDPSFALAHYQLGVLLASSGGSAPELKAHVDGALRSLDRLSRRDAAVVLAWKAHLDGRDDEALATYGKVLAEQPDDRHVLYLAGDLLFHRGDYPGALPYFQASLALEPDAEWPLDHLAQCLAITGRTAELRTLVARLSAPGASPAGRRLAIRGLTWLGEPAAAVALARRALAEGESVEASHDLAGALVVAGQFEEAEARVRAHLATRPGDFGEHIRLISVLAAQGRFGEARRLASELPAKVERVLPAEQAYLRASLAAGAGDLAGLREAALASARLQPSSSGGLLVLLALLGDQRLAREHAAALREDGTAARELGAIEAWRRGDRGAAAAGLALLEQRDPWPTDALAPAWLLAELAADGGDPSEVVAAVARFQRTTPRGPWRGWAWTRALLLEGRALERLGRREEALAAADRLLAVLRRADPGLPLLAEARALRGGLARAAPPAR